MFYLALNVAFGLERSHLIFFEIFLVLPTRRPTLKQIHASLAISEFCNGMPAVFPPPVVLN